MRKVLYAFAALLILAACDNKQFSTPAEEGKDVTKEVAFEIAKNYFFKNDQAIPTSPKITTEEDFEKLFGMATTMGEDGKPTEIDFTKKFVLAIVLPVTDIETEIIPIKVVEKNDTLHYTYKINTGEKLFFTIQPISIILLDKQYAPKQILLTAE